MGNAPQSHLYFMTEMSLVGENNVAQPGLASLPTLEAMLVSLMRRNKWGQTAEEAVTGHVAAGKPQ